MTRLLVCILGLAVFASFAPTAYAAETKNDRGKKLLLKLFEDAATTAAEATVRVQVDGKDAALGTVVSKDGYILTKGSELKGTITCKLRDGTAYDAEYIGYHKESDLALLKIDADDLQPAKLSPSKSAEPGNWVAVTGITTEPIAVGIISSSARKLFGQEKIIENANKGYLGIRFDATAGSKEEVVIAEVMPKLAAAKAGLKSGDIIFEVAGKKVKSRDALPEILDGYRPGDNLTIKVKRKVKDKDETEELSFKVTLSPRSEMSKGDMQNEFGGMLSGRRTGFPQVIQHDTVVLPKDCGGPLVDLDGRIVGINIARAGRVETWALPAEVITPLLKDLKAGKFLPPDQYRKIEK